MAFTESERVQIRRYMCWKIDSITISYDSLITRLQATSEGGVMADDSTELYVRDLLAKLAKIETKLVEFWDQMQADSVGSLRVDPARAAQVLRSEGRRYVHALARVLDAKPQADAFGPPPDYANREPVTS
jgi:hypothetical protein